ncbi:MAG: hypothetical protein KF760_30150 [Candidatus Eremiobacteraeota bacterium]|nr:hypothetical protein [Candidatus Eremiobacteraeota bacterium]MCW5872215.1 hypothetical protein [Candidatus Eremiobacteraeota bacterium]
MRWLLFVLLSLAAVAAPNPAASKDGSFTMTIPAEAQTLDNPNPSSMLNLVSATARALVVVTRSPSDGKTAAQLVKEIPKSMPWKISASKLGKVGGRQAAVFEASQVMKEYPNFKTVIGMVPVSKNLYIFQVHYAQGNAAAYEKWLNGVKWR